MKKIIIYIFIMTCTFQFMYGQNLKQANQLYNKKAFAEAAKLYEAETPKTNEVLLKLGDCYYFNSNMKNAYVNYKQVFDKDVSNINPAYIFRYVQTLKGLKKYDEADVWMKKYTTENNLPQQVRYNTFTENVTNNLMEVYQVKALPFNTEGSEFSPSYYNNKLVYASTQTNTKMYPWNNLPYLDLFIADIENENLINSKSFSNEINTKFHESNAVFTKDGKTMYFTSNNYNQQLLKKANNVNYLKIYSAQLVDGKWTNITALPFNSDTYSVAHPALNNDETKMYFASDMPGSYGSFDIYEVAINNDGSFGEPKNLGAAINTIHKEQFPFISSNNTLYFASNGHQGFGGLDVFKSNHNNGEFEKPTNLNQPINSNLDDFSFIINEKNNHGYFASNRSDGKGNDDIYAFTRELHYLIKGKTKDKNSFEVVPNAKVTLTNIANGKTQNTTSNNEGDFSFKVKNDLTYGIVAQKDLYHPEAKEINLSEADNQIFTTEVYLKSYKDVEEKVVTDNGITKLEINPIYFDFNKWNIRPDAAIELDEVVKIMKKYPTLEIEVEAHTDCRGSNAYNLELSKKRAKSVMDYLISRGIDKGNLSSVGYGETQPINDCIREGICTDEEYSVNRRCEFIIKN